MFLHRRAEIKSVAKVFTAPLFFFLSFACLLLFLLPTYGIERRSEHSLYEFRIRERDVINIPTNILMTIASQVRSK